MKARTTSQEEVEQARGTFLIMGLRIEGAIILWMTTITWACTTSKVQTTTSTIDTSDISIVTIELSNPEECRNFSSVVNFKTDNKTVVMSANRDTLTEKNHFCSWLVSAPAGKSIKITFNEFNLYEGARRCTEGKLSANEGSGYKGQVLFDYCRWGLPPDVISDQNAIQLQLSLFAGLPKVKFNFTFQVIPDHERPKIAVMVDPDNRKSGNITSPCFDKFSPYPVRVSDNYTIEVGASEMIMISFPQFDLYSTGNITDCVAGHGDSVSLYSVIGLERALIWRKCGLQSIFPQVYDHSLMVAFYSDHNLTRTGFKMKYTIHDKSKAPELLPSGKFNCYVPHYPGFSTHLVCNLFTECENGEDEHNCPYNRGLCNKSIAYENKCYEYFDWSRVITWNDAYKECEKRKMRLATLNTPKEWDAIESALDIGHRASMVFIGLRTANGKLPTFYRKMWQWSDDTIAYFVHMEGEHINPSCAALPWGWKNNSITYPCDTSTEADFICEYDTHEPEKEVVRQITFPTPIVTPLSVNKGKCKFTQCPANHVTYDFLSCDPASDCGVELHSALCETEQGGEMPMFSCDSGVRFVPYTLVCDHRPDCLDNSDEEFCEHGECESGTKQCKTSLECVALSQWCDGMQHCWDGLDEEDCFAPPMPEMSRLPPPAVIYLDGHGNFTQHQLRLDQPCPETHFRCAGESAYCLPVYLRCNGVFDCPGHEDEMRCDGYSCPGFYRCRSSRICVHAEHLCDGVFQCPEQDDERMCKLECPKGCRCQGLAFVCSRPFAADMHPELRYLDGSGSGITPKDLETKKYLLHLILASCDITHLESMPFNNLRTLDLSNNKIETVSTEIFHKLKNLRVLSLSNNPITSMTGSMSTFSHFYLHTVDLSQSKMLTFDTQPFSNFTNIRYLNLSFSPIHTIGEPGFSDTVKLEILDMTSVPLQNFPRKMLKSLHVLKTVYAENYRICCRVTLPDEFDMNRCFAPSDEISSCEDLLRSTIYRFFLWVFSTLAIVGNIGCFLFRFCIKERMSKVGFDVLVTNLCVSDFLMGVYLAIIGAADNFYQGNYIWHDTSWTSSIYCQIAGFLSFASCEVSAFIICLITFDRFLVFKYPFSVVRFQRKSAQVACGFVWAAGIIIAAIPLLPMTSGWQFYGQTGICIPLPITGKIVNGGQYSFGIMIVLNFVLFLLIAVGQVSIFMSVRGNSVVNEPARQTRDLAIARTLATIVLTDFLCWFPIGLLGLLASVGVFIPDEVNVGIAIFVLPVNSAINPFLYTFNTHMERRKRNKETEMIRCLEKRILFELCAGDDGKSKERRHFASKKDARDKIRAMVQKQRSFILSSSHAPMVSLKRYRPRRVVYFEEPSTIPSKKEAIAMIEDILDKEVLTLRDISPLFETRLASQAAGDGSDQLSGLGPENIFVRT